MGNKESKQQILTYDDAVKRVTQGELSRLKDAFERSFPVAGYMTRNAFNMEVVGEIVPERLTERMFTMFNGTSKGILFRDLLCGLVLLTHGQREEKIKFLFGLYANEQLTHILKLDMDSIVLDTEGQVPMCLSQLFVKDDQVTYQEFRDWLMLFPSATSMTRWLLLEEHNVTLSNDLETPTFYQTLAGVTHLEENDIIDLEKSYWLLKNRSTSGKFDLQTFTSIISPPLPEALCKGVFEVFDENRDNHIDFKEMACGISACCRGPNTERQKFCFKIFDTDHDGLLSEAELKSMIEAMIIVRQENCTVDEKSSDCLGNVDTAKLAEKILQEHGHAKSGYITQEDFLVWTVNHPLPAVFLDLLFQVCHVVLGLKPQNKVDEGKVIGGWVERENRHNLVVGQTWYLVNISWWKQWNSYVNNKPNPFPSLRGDSTSSSGSSSPSPASNRRAQASPIHSHSLLSKGHARKYSLGSDDSSVIATRYTSLSDNSEPGTPKSPQKDSDSSSSDISLSPRTLNVENLKSTSGSTTYSTLPKDHKVSSKLNGHAKTGVGNSNDLSVIGNGGGMSPLSSPRLGKKLPGGLNFGGNGSTVQKPGQIDNNGLVINNNSKIHVLTYEGGRLKRDKPLVRGRDFEIMSDSVWTALSSWYTGSPALPRNVIRTHGVVELELYPICVRLLKHQIVQQPANRQHTQYHASSTISGVIGGVSGMAANFVSGQSSNMPRYYTAFTASFSRMHTMKQIQEFLCNRLLTNKDNLRLWKYKNENNMMLLEDECQTVEEANIEDNSQLLIEIRNKDLSWPEEMVQLAKAKLSNEKKQLARTEKGATGLNNLGNTCFMNSALQCISNTQALTMYLNCNMHLYELNRVNPLGMKGHIAQRYGELVKDLWSGMSKTVAPLKLRWTIGKYAPRFNDCLQHDSQELLAFLLDGLHEDLNRVQEKPYVELKDSDGRCDEIVAKEAWDNHLRRNQSVIVDLFHGQLKSQVRCLQCGHTSVRFDPFTFLSLPLPMDSCIHLEVMLIRLDGSMPIKYGMRLNSDKLYKNLKEELCNLTSIPASQFLLVEISGALVKYLPHDSQKINTQSNLSLYAYELPAVSQNVDCDNDQAVNANPTSSKCDTSDEGIGGGLGRIQRMHSNPGSDHNANSKGNSIPNGKLPHSSLVNSNSAQPSPKKTLANSNAVHASPSKQSTNHDKAFSKPAIHKTASPKPSTKSPRNTAVSSKTPVTNGWPSGLPDPSIVNGSDPTANQGPLFVVAVHRKMNRMDVYFLSSQKTRPQLFGTPLILPFHSETSHRDLYAHVWLQVARLVSPLPPTHIDGSTINHAKDCDDSLGYEYPFALKAVQRDGLTCAWCPWYRFCRGCTLKCTTEKFNFHSNFLAVDWEPNALHLRYQGNQEKVFISDPSIAESRRQQTEPIDLDACLKAFTREEELGDDEQVHCSKCKKHQSVAKKLQIWRLPPILIIHLKRFQQLMDHRWVKSQKIVRFPFRDFDPNNYVAPRQPGYYKHFLENNKNVLSANGSIPHDENDQHHVDDGIEGEVFPHNEGDAEKPEPVCPASPAIRELRQRHMSTMSNFSIESAEDYTDVRYKLYALSCHTGVLAGGHYVSYARNPNNNWYLYNDSSCKDIVESDIERNSAYMLFYERADIEHSCYLPDIRGKNCDMSEIDDECEADLKKTCVLQ